MRPVDSVPPPQPRSDPRTAARRWAASRGRGRGNEHGTDGYSRGSVLSIPPRRAPTAAESSRGGAALAELAARIEEFRVTADRFFNGALRIPPEDLRQRIVRELRDIRNEPLRSAADQFRLNGLEARFNSLSELFARRLREREEGPHSGARQLPGHEQEKVYDPSAGVVLDSRGTDPAAVEALFAGLARGGAARNLDLDSFRTYLERQVREIGEKTGAGRVQFRLAQEEGKIKLKARPLRAGESGESGE